MDIQTVLFDILVTGADMCRVALDGNGSLIASLFLAGLVGSLTHCIGMCGPFVLAQVGARLEAVPLDKMSEFSRLTGAALAPYHLGRMTTYMVLGALGATLAGGAAQVSGFKGLSAALLALAALFFLGYALKRLSVLFPATLGWLSLGRKNDGGGETAWSKFVSSFAGPLFARPVGWRGYALGILLGFIPCGLLYGALAASAAAETALGGAFVMAAFAAGTIPALLAMGLLGNLAVRKWREAAGWAAPLLMIVNAVILGFMAWRLAG